MSGPVATICDCDAASVCLAELLQLDALSMLDQDSLHTQCRADHSQLREEYERYKLRAQSVLKNKSTKVGPALTSALYTCVM